MITNHGFNHVVLAAVFSKISRLKQSKRWITWLSLLRSCANKIVLFMCLESLLAGLILFGTGYIAVLS